MALPSCELNDVVSTESDWIWVGNLATWATAFATLFLGIVAIRALGQGRLEIDYLRQQLETERGKIETSLARQVSCWPNAWSVDRVECTVRNGGSEPIYDIGLKIFSGSRAISTRYVMAMMAPNEGIDVEIATSADPAERPSTDITFTDSTGVRWHRAPDGKLLRLGEA